MAKRKTGLHKEISAIFDGVPLPNNNGRENSGATATMERDAGHIPPLPTAPPPEIRMPAVPPQAAPVAARPSRVQPKPVRSAKPAMSGLVERLRPLWDDFKTKVLTPEEGVSQIKHTVTVVLIPILLIVVLVVFGKMFIKPSRSRGKKQVAGLTTVAASVKSEIDWKVPAPYPTNLRDPMSRVSAGAASNGAGELMVKGIVYSSDKPSAAIGTQIIYEGETVFGAKVLKINKNSVEFEKDGKKWTQKVQH